VAGRARSRGLLQLLGSALYQGTPGEREDTSLSAIWNEWLEPLLGFTEVGLLLAAVYLTIAQFTRSRASSYIERINSSDMLDCRAAVDAWLHRHSTNRSRLEALEADPVLRTQVRGVDAAGFAREALPSPGCA